MPHRVQIDAGSRAFIFGGTHGNLQATHAILERAKALGFSPDQMVCTGDTVAYCANPQETVDLIREAGIAVLMGNCEESLANGSDDCGCGFAENSACDLLSAQWFNFCKTNIGNETRAWMAGLPKTIELTAGPLRFEVIHGSPKLINQFVFASDIASSTYCAPDRNGLSGYIAGHSGIPFIAEANGLLWLNSGAAGMPANDGTPRVWYATLEAGAEGVMAATHAIKYDHETAIRAMKAAGLDNGYAECLATGIWPSQEVLPAPESAQTGKAN